MWAPPVRSSAPALQWQWARQGLTSWLLVVGGGGWVARQCIGCLAAAAAAAAAAGGHDQGALPALPLDGGGSAVGAAARLLALTALEGQPHSPGAVHSRQPHVHPSPAR